MRILCVNIGTNIICEVDVDVDDNDNVPCDHRITGVIRPPVPEFASSSQPSSSMRVDGQSVHHFVFPLVAASVQPAFIVVLVERDLQLCAFLHAPVNT